MDNKQKFLQRFENEFSEREFDPKETLQWLSRNRITRASWGFQKPTALKESGLMFKVNGHHHKGWVLITLAWNDTYTLRFFSTQFNEVKEKITDVYCDELQERVDIVIERIKEYNS